MEKHEKNITFEYISEICGMSTNDFKRLMECVTCQHDPYHCGCTEADENEKGHCQKYICRRGIKI